MARRRISLPRRWRTVLAALLSLAALLGPATGTAQAPKPAQTWAAEWEVLAPGAPLAGSLRDVVREAQGQELLLAAGAESGHFESAVHDMGREFGAVAALWTALPSDAAALTLEVQVSRDGLSWSPWQALVRDDLGAERAPEALSHSELVFERGRYVRLRVTLNKRPAAAGPRLKALKLVAIDASEGPTPLDSKIALAVSDSAPPAPPSVISRAAWGANEAYMTWPPEYAPVTHFVIHHTATSNASADADPYQVVRTIYYYHAVELRWGDIGYNFLVDRQGRIYEGRYGGDRVIGGHARPYNRGTVGVAVLGDYTPTAPGSEVPPGAALGLEKLLHWKCAYHGIDPLASSWIYDRTLPNVMGHRDCNQTTCPGDRLYALLPAIRSDVANMLRESAPQVTITKPAAGATVWGLYEVTWQVNWAVSQVSLYVDSSLRQTLPASTTSWTWNTEAEPGVAHQLRLVARNGLGQSAASEVAVQIDNAPPAWGQPGASGLPVADTGSGLDSSAAYATSGDGIAWSDWTSATLTLAPDGLSGILPPQGSWQGRCVRARVSDRAGHVIYSPPIRWPTDADPAPEYRWWGDCGCRVWVPLALR